MSKRQIIETVLVTTQTGKTTVVDITQDIMPHTWTRAYVRGTTGYYDIDHFEANLHKAAKVERISIFDLPYIANVDEQGCLVD